MVTIPFPSSSTNPGSHHHAAHHGQCPELCRHPRPILLQIRLTCKRLRPSAGLSVCRLQIYEPTQCRLIAGFSNVFSAIPADVRCRNTMAELSAKAEDDQTDSEKLLGKPRTFTERSEVLRQFAWFAYIPA